MSNQPPEDTTNELAAALLDEVPAAGRDFWTKVDDRLGPTTSAPLMDITAPPPERSRRRLMPVGIAAAIAVAIAAFFAVQTFLPSNADFAQSPFDLPRNERPGPTANLDHWHGVYGVWDCTANDGDGDWIPPFESTEDDVGIHSHGEGLIYIHPFFEEVGLENATFSHFADSMNIEVEDDRIVLDDGVVLNEGATCAGEPAQVRLLRWEHDLQLRNNRALPPLVITENLGAERFYNDREVWVLAFAPVSAEIPMLPIERFQELDKWIDGSVPLPLPDELDRIDRAREVPIADVYLSGAPGAGQSSVAADLFEVRRQANHLINTAEPAQDTIDHIATLDSARRSLDIFRYRSGDQTCVAALSTQFGWPGGQTACFDPAESTEVVVSIAVNPIPQQSPTALNVLAVANAPSDAVWMMILTDAGERISVLLTDDFAYAEWRPGLGTATRVQLLNESLDQVWVSTDLANDQ